MGVEDCVRAEENNSEIYMKKSEERLIIASKDILYEQGESVYESGSEYKERMTIERGERMFEWTKSGYVKTSTERFLNRLFRQLVESKNIWRRG